MASLRGGPLPPPHHQQQQQQQQCAAGSFLLWRLLSFLLLFAAFGCGGVVAGMEGFPDAELIAGGKMWDNGTYARVRGVNVIAMVGAEKWARAAEGFLRSKKLGKMYSPLSAESFHATLHPLFTENELPNGVGKLWDSAIVEVVAPTLFAAQKWLHQRPIALHPLFDGISAGPGVLALRMRVSEAERSAVQQLWHVIANASIEVAKNSQGRGRASAAAAVVADTIAGELLQAARDFSSYRFHITLGYAKFDPFLLTQADTRQAVAELHELEDIVRETACGEGATDDDADCAVATDPARVFWFEDMEHFVPVELADGDRALLMFGRKFATIRNACWFGSSYEVLFAAAFVFLSGLTVLACWFKSRRSLVSHRKRDHDV